MAKLVNIDIEKLVRTYIHTCIEKGLTVNKGFELLDELMIMIDKKIYDEKIWMEKIDIAIAEAQNEAGAMQ